MLATSKDASFFKKRGFTICSKRMCSTMASTIHQSPPVALSSPSAAPSNRSISQTSTAVRAAAAASAVAVPPGPCPSPATALVAVAVPPEPPLEPLGTPVAPAAEASDDDDDSLLPTVYPLTPVCAPLARACAGTFDRPETRSVKVRKVGCPPAARKAPNADDTSVQGLVDRV